MNQESNLKVISYSEQIFSFKQKIFLLRLLFYITLLISLLLNTSYGYLNIVALYMVGLLTLANLILYLVFSRKLFGESIVVYFGQLLDISLMFFLVEKTGGGDSIFALLFIIEGLFCGLFYSIKCVLGYFGLLIPFSLYLCLSSASNGLLLLLSLIGSIFATLSTFLLIREQDNKKLEIISYYIKLQKLNERLIGIGRLRKNFMDIAYHDMRSPLSTVIGFLQNILAGYGGTVTDKQADWIKRCVDRLDTLSRQINDLYFLANIESTDFNEIKKRCDVLQEIELAISEVLEKLNKKNQKFIKNISSTVPWVVVVPILFRQCLVNLLENATKYTPSGGVIELDVYYNDDWLTLEVKDNGIGIPDEFKPRIFDEFFRVKNTVVDNQRPTGTGLGLTIVKSIMDGHGGRVEVRDNRPHGTIFIVKFPMVGDYKEA